MAVSTVSVNLPSAYNTRRVKSLSRQNGLSKNLGSSTSDSSVGIVSLISAETITYTASDGTVISDERAQFDFPYAPNDIKIDGLTDNYTQLERPGLKPLVRRQSKGAMKVSFTARIAYRPEAGTTSCEEQVRLLSSIASLNVDLYLLGLGVLVSGIKFRITDMNMSTVRMNPDQKITIADVAMTFTEVIEVGKPVPGMTYLKDPPQTNTVAKKHKSGSKAGPSGAEIDYWTAAKMLTTGAPTYA